MTSFALLLHLLLLLSCYGCNPEEFDLVMSGFVSCGRCRDNQPTKNGWSGGTLNGEIDQFLLFWTLISVLNYLNTISRGSVAMQNGHMSSSQESTCNGSVNGHANGLANGHAHENGNGRLLTTRMVLTMCLVFNISWNFWSVWSFHNRALALWLVDVVIWMYNLFWNRDNSTVAATNIKVVLSEANTEGGCWRLPVWYKSNCESMGWMWVFLIC